VKDVFIVGYGNPLRSDDGFGPRVAELSEEALAGPGIEIVASHQLVPEFAERLSRCGLAVFVDVSTVGTPGRLEVSDIDPDDASRVPLGHTLGPAALLALASEVFGRAPRAVLISTAAVSLDLGERLSPAVEEAAVEAVAAIRRLVSGPDEEDAAPAR
jgi:hydrogenase maturation protease